MNTTPFDARADAYEAMIDWPRRLQNEEPFYRKLFERIGATRILDAACGAGYHAAMFHRWGLEVQGADLSGEMIQRCQRNHRADKGLTWQVRGYHEPVPPPADFDVVLCVGNSLALAGDGQTVAAAIQAMLQATQSGGFLLLHVLNLWRMKSGPVTWQKCKRTHLGGTKTLIIKGVHRVDDQGYVDILTTRLDEPQLTLDAESVLFRGLRAEQIEQHARAAGAKSVEFFGDYQQHPYEPQSSVDLIALIGK